MAAITRQLAEFICSADLDKIPKSVIELSKLAVIDHLAVTLGGYPVLGETLETYVSHVGGRGTATVAVSGSKTTAPVAALVNGTLAHALDFDDLNQSMGGHPSAPVWPAATAAGETIGASGSDVLLAYILGVEIETKFGRAIIDTLYTSGWHPTAVLGTLGAAAAAGKILGLTPDQLQKALGIAASFASGFKKNFGTMTKPLHVGQAAQNGIQAALLSQAGFDSSSDSLEGSHGFINQFCGSMKLNSVTLINSLGNPWEFESPGVQFKKYPCCGSIHSSIEALLEIVNQHSITPRDIRQITCHVHPDKTHILGHPFPGTKLEAKFSLKYCIAAGLLHNELSLKQFTDESVCDEEIQSLLSRISALTDKNLESWAGRIQIETCSGKTFTGQYDQFPSISDVSELTSKFYDCAAPRFAKQWCDKIINMVQQLEKLENISCLYRFTG